MLSVLGICFQLVHRVEDSEEDFDKISAAIKKELELIDETRFDEFKAAAIGFLTTMLQIQEKASVNLSKMKYL